MKTKIFLSALVFAIAAIVFTYNNSYSSEKSCCCTDCKCSTCACAETCCKDNACGGCGSDNCCDSKNNSNTSGGVVSGDSALVCLVSGEKIESGKEVVVNYLGKDYNFCCEDCAAGFKTEPIKYIKEGLNCPVMDEPAKKDVNVVVNGTKYYFCCKMCIKDFQDNPDKYLKKDSQQPKTDDK